MTAGSDRWLACRWVWAWLALLPGPALAQAADAWTQVDAAVRLGFENVELPGGETMGLAGASYRLQLRPGLCAGPAVYGAATGQRGGLFVVGAEAALCTPLAGALSLEAGLFVGGGGGGAAPVGGGLMLRPHADLMWDFGPLRAGISLSRVYFPSGQIDSTQLGLVLAMPTGFSHLSPGAVTATDGGGRTGFGFDRVLAVAGAYHLPADSVGNGGAALGSRIGYVGLRAERRIAGHLYGGLEVNGAASGGAAGYAELLGELGAEVPLSEARATLGARVALGLGGGGAMPVGGGLLAKTALDAQLRFSPAISLGVEAGWARTLQGSFSAPFGALALHWDLDAPQGGSTQIARQTFAGGVETYRAAARKAAPPQSLQSVSFKIDRFVGEAIYLTGQLRSAYAGDAGAFAVGLFGVGAQARLGQRWLVGAELLAGAAGGGGVDTGSGAVVQQMAYVALELTRALSVRLGAGRVKAIDGALDSTVADLTLAFSFGVGD